MNNNSKHDLPPRKKRFFGTLAPGGERALLNLVVIGVTLLFAFPIFWLVLTSIRPAWGVFYVHEFFSDGEATLDNFGAAFEYADNLLEAFINSFVISTIVVVISLIVTVSSGYMLSRFKGPLANSWFMTIYFFRCIPYISWVLPLYFVTQNLGIYDSYLGLILPRIAVHVCFFSWIMMGFFDGINPSMEHAAMIDGCTRWGAFWRVAVPSAIPGITALAILGWLYSWNEFLFSLILTSLETPILTVVMSQFVHEMGMEWHLMSATATMALIPAIIVTIFGQKYVIRGLSTAGKA